MEADGRGGTVVGLPLGWGVQGKGEIEEGGPLRYQTEGRNGTKILIRLVPTVTLR